MQTVVIWDSVDADVLFFVVDRDISHLDKKYVNSVDVSEEDEREISNLMYDEKTGDKIIATQTTFPVDAVLAGAKVIVCGFLP